jgi:hypothetical protein
MKLKFTFTRETQTCMIWANDLFEASDMVGIGWDLFSISK